MLRNIAAIVSAAMLTFSSCSSENAGESAQAEGVDNDSIAAATMLTEARSAFDNADFDKALLLTDSVHKVSPGSADLRHRANHLHALAMEQSLLLQISDLEDRMVKAQASIDSIGRTLREEDEASMDLYVKEGQELRSMSIEREKLERMLTATRNQIARTLPD